MRHQVQGVWINKVCVDSNDCLEKRDSNPHLLV